MFLMIGNLQNIYVYLTYPWLIYMVNV
jgi:hypothetical protein